MSELLNVDRLSLSIAGKQVCDALDWQVKAGQHWAVMGLNGVGKTTLLNYIAGLYPTETGSIKLLGRAVASYDPKLLAKHLGYLLQSLSYEFPQTVNEFCVSALHPHINRWESISQQHEATINNALELTGMATYQNRLLSTLSGGEKRRVEIAALMIQQPMLWLLDEPLSHLDLHRQLQMMQLLIDSANRTGGATISILHDPNLVYRFSTHVLMLLGHGEYTAGKSTQLLTPANLSRLFQHPVSAVSHRSKRVFIAD